MISHYPYNNLAKADHGWLKSRHHFSFANYYDPKRMGFGSLRVINDDRVEPGSGFAHHPHKNMEIISYVRSGALSHEDSLGNKGTTHSGEVQVMSAGSGITHSEYNYSDTTLTFYQIWIKTNQTDVSPRWESKLFPKQAISKQLPLLVSGYPDDPGDALFIHQKARIFGGRVAKGSKFEHAIEHQAYILASEGSFELQDAGSKITLYKGDGAEIQKSKTVNFTALTDCEVLVIDAPAL